MKELDPIEKLNTLIQEAWEIFMAQFIGGRIHVTTEAPFQHYLANVIKSLGDLYCFSRTETFLVDLETKEENIRGRKKYIDITFGFYDGAKVLARGAMELKFKRKDQGADDFARIDSYQDIECLEVCLERDYDVAYFGMISDNKIYANPSRQGTTGQIFSMRSGYQIPVNTLITNPNCKGRQDIGVFIKKEHTFKWEDHGKYISLCMPVHRSIR